MTSIDQRIVELKFDASKFRSGIQAAIASLDNLKKKLNLDKAAHEFDKVEKASRNVTFSELYSSVDSISNRFSSFGIVGMSVLNNLANTAVNAGKRILSALTEPLIGGGKRRALNIEQAKFQIEGLGYAWADVEEDINYGVKDTAYGLDAAAKAASQLLASQVKVGDEMKASLRGISGVAAMTSSEYEDVANIFTTVAGNGRLMGDQLMQLSTRGLNAAATLGQYLGKSEAEVREMTSKGQIDFATFAAAMDSAFGEHAKKANETFTGSLSNMKAALARIGANFATPAYQNLRDIFNALTPAIDGVKDAMDPLVKTAEKAMKIVSTYIKSVLPAGKEARKIMADKIAPLMKSINRLLTAIGTTLANLFKIVRNIVSPIVSAFKEIFGTSLIDILAGAVEILAKFTEQLVFTERMSNNLKKTFKGIFTIISVVINILSSIVGVVSGVLFDAFGKVFGFVADILLTITGYIGDLIVRIKSFVDSLIALDTVQQLLSTIAAIFAKIGDIINKVYSAIRKLATVILDATFESALWIFDKIASAILLIAKFIDRVIQKVIEFVDYVRQLPAVQKFVQKISDTFYYLKENTADAAQMLKGKFVDAFNTAKRVISSFINKVRELIGQYVKLPTLQEVVANVQTFITNIFEKSSEVFEKVKEFLSDIFDRAKELGEVSFKNIVENLGKLRDRIVEVIDVGGKLTFLKDVFTSIGSGASSAATTTIGVLNVIKDKVGEFVNAITERFGQLTVGDIMAAGIGGTFIVFLYQLTKFVKTADKLTTTLDKTVGWISKLQKSVSGVIDNFAKLEKAKATSMKMDALAGIIKSVAMLAAAVALLATMDQEKVKSSAVVIGVLAGVLVALAGAMTYLLQKVDLFDLAKSISSMIVVAGSILVLAIALKMISDVPTEGIAERLIALGVLMAELVGAMIVLSKFAKDMPEATVSILALSLSLNLLARALRNIGEIGVENIISSMAVLSVLLLCLALIVKVAGKADLTWESALGILSIVIAIRILIGALDKLAKMDTATIAKAITRLIVIMGAMAVLFVSTKLAGEYAVQAGGALIMMGIALNIMVLAIKQLAGISKSQLKQASDSIVGILGVFALITAMTKLAGKNAAKAGVAILLMAASMVAISGAMILLGKLKEDELTRATKAVTTVMGMFAIIVASTGLMRKADKTLTVIAVTIGVLAGALAVLSLIEPKNLLAASAALSMLLGSFAIVVASTGMVKKAEVTIALMVGVVGVLFVLIKKLAEMPWENTLAAAASMSMVILSLAATTKILQTVNPQAALYGIAGFAIVVAGLGALMAALGGLTYLFPDLEQWIRDGLPLLEAIGQGIGYFVGGIVGGLAAGATSTLPVVAASLSTFMKTLQPFIKMVEGVDDSALAGARNVVEMVMLFAVADFIDGLNFFGGSGSAIINMSKFLPKLGEGMRTFSESLQGVNLRRLQVGSECAKAIAEIANTTREGGLTTGIFGSGSEGMKALTDNLPAFGEALKAYGDSLDGLKSDQINASIEPARGIIEIANAINGEGGLLQELGGSSSEGLKKLSENLPILGEAMVSYGKAIYAADFEGIKQSAGAVKSLVEVANLIKGEGGALQAIAGSNALGTEMFTENLKRLGESLLDYSLSLHYDGGVDYEAINASIDPLKALIEIAKSIDAEGGFLQAIVGSQALGDKLFAENLSRLGIALAVFSDHVKDVGGEGVDTAIHVAGSIADILSRLQPSGGLFEQIFGSQESSFSKFNSNLVGLGLGLKLYCEQVAGIDGSGVEKSIQAARGIAGVVRSLPEDNGLMQKLMGGKMEAMSSFADNLGNLGSGIKEYSDKVSGLDMSGVEPSIKVLKQLVHLSTIIEDAGGVSGFWFGDKQQALQALSENIKRLGDAMSYISQLNIGDGASAVSTMMTALVMLVNTSRSWGELGDIKVKGDDIVYFGNKYNSFGQDISGIDFGAVQSGVYWLGELIKVIQNFPQIDNASANFSTFIVTLRNVGINTVDAFVAALQDGGLRAGKAAYEMVNQAINQAKLRCQQAYIEFSNHGKNFMLMMANGIRGGKTYVDSAIVSVVSDLYSKIVSHYSEMVEAGEYLCLGVSQGISNGYWWPINNVGAMGDDMVARLRDRLGIASPAKEGIAIGKFWDQGVALGVIRYTKDVLSAIDDSSDQMLDRFNSGKFLPDLDLQPIITPELDTSLVDKGIDALDARLSSMNGVPVSVQGSRLASAFANVKKAELAAAEIQNGTPSQVINNYDMTQNNYSPKALSRIDIYRKTNAQFSRLKGVTNLS